MLALGTSAPAFSLKNAVDGCLVSMDGLASDAALLVMFICNHCPFVQHVQAELGRLAADYRPKGLTIVAINSNDLDEYPQDGPVYMKELALSEGWEFPFLFDETQAVAEAYKAACTRDFSLFDAERRLVYRGQLDSSRPSNSVPVDGADLRAAINAVLKGEDVAADQKPSVGCNIKWKPGNEPEYTR